MSTRSKRFSIVALILGLIFALTGLLAGRMLLGVSAAELTDNTGGGTDFSLMGSGGAAYSQDTNTQDVWVMSAWGQRAVYKTPVSLDDFEMEFKFTGAVGGDKFGFGFDPDSAVYWEKGTTVLSVLVDRYIVGVDQLSLRLTKTHDPTNNPYTKEDGSFPSRYVINDYDETKETTIRFSSKLMTDGDNAGNYQFTYQMVSEQTFSLPYEGADQEIVFYVTPEQVFGEGQSASDVYLFYGAMSSTQYIPVTVTKLKDNKAIAYADAQVTAYENADGSDIEAAIAARAAATAAVGKVSIMHDDDLAQRISAKDSSLKENQEFVAAVQAKLNGQVDAYTAAAEVLSDESAITEEAIAAARTAASGVDKTLFDFLSDEDKTTIESEIVANDYIVAKADILKNVIAYEAKVAQCETEKTAALVLECEEMSAQVSGISLNNLTEEDAQAVESRISVADEKVAAVKVEIKDQFADYYLQQYEIAVGAIDTDDGVAVEDITLDMIADAISAKGNVDFDETHPQYDDLQARMEACNAILEKSVSAVYTAKLAEAKTILQDSEQNADLVNVAKAEDIINSIDVEAIADMDCYEAIQTEYSSVKTILEQSALYGFKNNGMEYTRLTDKGVSTAGYGVYPNRLNFNKPVDMTDAKAVVSVDKYAYFNSETDDPDLGANNLTFQFLTAPDSYKGIDHGFTIMVWVFEAQCNVEIYDYNDSPIVSASISTPPAGGNFVIRVGLFDDMWIVKVNEAELVLGNSKLVGIDKDIFKQGDEYIGYFSVGCFADTQDLLNEFTVKQVGDFKFTDEEFTFPDFDPDDSDDPVDPIDPVDPVDPDDDNNNLGLILGITIPCVVVVAVGGFCLYWFVFRKKKL